eukprot:TRINITY_DN267_c1_g2_i1.p1 TRINITY_DN267_c1_g2~~TRINITY_DN267_c1_g2_i1.p1  ORF type:complete len:451 (-),score=86.25 TRINITY_DN267_c1_g2_i1:533-1885(-)
MNWKCAQVFGDKGAGDVPLEADIISCVEFDDGGENIAIGDRGGRVVILKKRKKDEMAAKKIVSKTGRLRKSRPVEYTLFSEFQSHEPEFDYLKSLEIEEKINKIKWLPHVMENHHVLLSTNDKTIKLWRVNEHQSQEVVSMSTGKGPSGAFGAGVGTMPIRRLALPKITYGEIVVSAHQKRVFSNAHAYHINSISLSSDKQTFLSADDLRVNLWHIGLAEQSFNVVDIKPESLDEVFEVITTASFHPSHCSLFLYSTSRGATKLCDVRNGSTCDRDGKQFLAPGDSSKEFFSELVCSVSDAKFLPDGRHFITRDYLTVKLWDVNMESKPVRVINVHDHLRSHLCDLYECDAIFDRFDIGLSGDGTKLLTGSYEKLFHVYDIATGKTLSTVEATKSASKKKPPKRTSSARLKKPEESEEDPLMEKVSHVSWHPKANIIACACKHHLYVYHS